MKFQLEGLSEVPTWQFENTLQSPVHPIYIALRCRSVTVLALPGVDSEEDYSKEKEMEICILRMNVGIHCMCLEHECVHLPASHVSPENESKYSYHVSLENGCVYSWHVYLEDECLYSLHASLKYEYLYSCYVSRENLCLHSWHVHLEDEFVHSFRVSLENKCMHSCQWHVSLEHKREECTPWNISDVYECRVTGCTGRTPNVGVEYLLESTS